MVSCEMQLNRFRRGDAYELSLRFWSRLMLHNVVHSVQSSQKSCQIIAEATERPFEKTDTSSVDQLLTEVIEKRAHLYVWKKISLN